MNSKLFLIVAATLIVAMGGVAQAAILFSDDFEAYNVGDSIGSTGKWAGDVGQANKDIFVSAGGPTGQFADGTTSKTLPGYPSALNVYHLETINSGLRVLTADIVFQGKNQEFGIKKPSAPEWVWLNWGVKADGVTVHLWSENNWGSMVMPNFTVGQVIHSELILDYANGQFKGTLSRDGGTVTATTGWKVMTGGASLYAGDQIYIYNYINGVNGILLDNVMLTDGVIPEPSSMLALLTGLGAAAGIIRRRMSK